MIPPKKTVFFFVLACPSLTNVIHLTSPHLASPSVLSLFLPLLPQMVLRSFLLKTSRWFTTSSPANRRHHPNPS